MKIYVASGVGQGPSEIAALDAALAQAGALNYNLIPMTSIIPPDTEIVDGSLDALYGSRVYVVMAKAITFLPGSYACAALAWAQFGDGRGVFAEAHGHDEVAVLAEVDHTLAQMLVLRQSNVSIDDCSGNRHTTVQLVDDRVACAVVVAYYEAQGWGDGPMSFRVHTDVVPCMVTA